MNIKNLQETTNFTLPASVGIRNVSNVQRNTDDGGEGAYDPFQYGTSDWDLLGLSFSVTDQVFQHLALWLVQNLDHPLALILKQMYGFDDQSLEEFLTSEAYHDRKKVRDLFLRVIKYWGDPNLGTVDPSDPDSGPFIPDFPFRGPLMTGNIGSGEGYGGIFKSLKGALNQFLQDLYDDSVEGVSGHMNAWLIQMIQILLLRIQEAEQG